jgi:hypothetical protein
MSDKQEHIVDEPVELSLEDRFRNFLRFDEKNWFNNMPLVLFVANNHTAENKIRRINSIEKDIRELRWTYMTSKSELMYKSKQSEVAKMVEAMDLKELTKPPYKIVVKSNEYE